MRDSAHVPMRRIEVTARSAASGAAEPIRLTVGDEPLDVLGIDDRWVNATARYFKLAASDGCIYLVRHDFDTNSWALVQVWRLDA